MRKFKTFDNMNVKVKFRIRGCEKLLTHKFLSALEQIHIPYAQSIGKVED